MYLHENSLELNRRATAPVNKSSLDDYMASHYDTEPSSDDEIVMGKSAISSIKHGVKNLVGQITGSWFQKGGEGDIGLDYLTFSHDN
jgi:hypothetical protein